MWNQSGFDQSSGGGDQGGGYLTSPGQFGSPQMSQERKSRQKAQSLMPCTIAQVFSAQQADDRFLIDNIELHQVTVVGLIRTVKESATRLDYQVDDMTSQPIEVRQFVDNDENTPEEERTLPMRENTYVRIFGHVRAFQNKRSLVAFRIVPLVDMNELTTHMLEVVHSHMALTKGAAEAGGGGGGGAMDQSVSTGDNAQGNGYSGALPDNLNGLTPHQQQVLFMIRGFHDEQGVNIGTLCEKLRGMPQKTIRESVEFLSSEGHIYSTIDDEHFKCTDTV